MNASTRFASVVAYIPVIGWLYVLLFQPRNVFAVFHLRQAIGLVLFLIVVILAYLAFSWVISWIPYGFLIANALFALIMATSFFVIIMWIIGMINAAQGRATILPVFGRRASRLPIGQA
jgi:uncharacterized membrane protein